MYLNFSEIKELHIELTNKCNAACPMCGRNEYGGKTKPELKPAEWTTSFAKKVFDARLTSLQNIMVCGCYGDPTMAKEALQILEVAKTQTTAKLEFYSNGSTRTQAWWAELGQLFSSSSSSSGDHERKYDLAIFSIDGLSDTNHIYRRGTSYEKIIENAKAYIQAGGNARWDFIVFKHNQHQVQEAEKIALEMGFKEFRIRKTSRFYYSPDGPTRHRVQNANGETEYYLEPTNLKKYYNQEIDKFSNIKAKNPTLNEFGSFLKKTEVNCIYKNIFKRVYINTEGKVFPCCYLGADSLPSKNKLHADLLEKMITRYGSEFNCLVKNDWQEIIEHDFFKSQMPKSFESNDANRLFRCGRTCGKEFNPILSQSENKILEN